MNELMKGEREFGEWVFSLTEEDWADLKPDDFMQLSQMYLIHQTGHFNAALFKHRFEFFKRQIEYARQERKRIAERILQENPT